MLIPQAVVDRIGSPPDFVVGFPGSWLNHACMIRFSGGPVDGKVGLYDHDEYAEINFRCVRQGMTWQYTKAAPFLYKFSGILERER